MFMVRECLSHVQLLKHDFSKSKKSKTALLSVVMCATHRTEISFLKGLRCSNLNIKGTNLELKKKKKKNKLLLTFC